ncbi:MAG: 2,4-dihydroxyhept-2-ene-1,7-dioic acid aldolase [Acetobacteraceae bacterium]|nr:2,4-dihydroxyhept-2-ene-1,7-dioic acid aldolase [Acetobacteraceae bacterium]
MRSNRLRQKLDAGLPTLGTHILSSWPTLVELIGAAGGHYDYVEFTAEYAPFNLYDLDNLGRALELAGIAGMIKVEQGEYTTQSMRAIGSGFQSVLFADVRTVADAQAAVAAVRAETPGNRRGFGLTGVGMRRDVGTNREVGSPAYTTALDDAVVVLMVEKRQCVENLDAILDVPGIDMVQFGSADYAMSIGHANNRGHKDVRAAEIKTIETALKKGIHPRIEIAEPDQAAPYLAMGVKHFCIGWDVGILSNFWKTRGETMQGLLSAKPAKPTKKTKAPKDNYK